MNQNYLPECNVNLPNLSVAHKSRLQETGSTTGAI